MLAQAKACLGTRSNMTCSTGPEVLTTYLCDCDWHSRAFIREAEQDVDLPVPSPTYLLQELYEEHAGMHISVIN